MKRSPLKGLQQFVAWIATIAVCALVLLAVGTYVISCVIKPFAPPKITEAPWLIQTSSMHYYAKSYSVVNGVPTITDYWVVDYKDRYQFVKGSMAFPNREFGQIAVIRRTK